MQLGRVSVSIEVSEKERGEKDRKRELRLLRSGVYYSVKPKGSHMLPIQVFATRIKAFDRQKVLGRFLEHLIFKGSKVKLQLCVLDQLILAILDPSRKHFYNRTYIPLIRLRSQLDRIQSKATRVPQMEIEDRVRMQRPA